MAGNDKISKAFANRPLIICVLYMAAYFTVITCLVGVVLAYLFRSAKIDDWTASHYTYAIRTFWMIAVTALLMSVGVALLINDYALGILLAFPFSIMVVLGGVRTVFALVNAASETPMPNPRGLII